MTSKTITLIQITTTGWKGTFKSVDRAIQNGTGRGRRFQHTVFQPVMEYLELRQAI